MFKHLGRFAILAVCLFAIVIVMVGCGPDDPPPPPPPPPLVETPMEKLIGVYELAELVVERDGGSVTLRPPTVSGSLGLFSDNTFSLFTIGAEGNVQEFEGPWTADGTHITLDGDRSQYSWDGTHLTIFGVSGGTKTRFKWRKS